VNRINIGQCLESSLVSNKSFSEILWPSSWALGQVTRAKMAKNYFTCDVTHKKSETLNQNIFFKCRLGDLPNLFRVWISL